MRRRGRSCMGGVTSQRTAIMVRTTAALIALLFFSTIGCSDAATRAVEPAKVVGNVVGRVVLPAGEGPRGIAVILTMDPSADRPAEEWVLLDEDNAFSKSVRGELTRVRVVAGSSMTVRELTGDAVPRPHASGTIDLGEIDVRDLVTPHRLRLATAPGSEADVVRVGMWFSDPDPEVSMASRQFPELRIGDTMEWLVPEEAEAIYFMSERPADEGRGLEWRSGKKTLIGPFRVDALPEEIVVE